MIQNEVWVKVWVKAGIHDFTFAQIFDSVQKTRIKHKDICAHHLHKQKKVFTKLKNKTQKAMKYTFTSGTELSMIRLTFIEELISVTASSSVGNW